MKRQIAAFTFALFFFLTACGGGEAPASSSSSAPADSSQGESPPAEVIPFTLAVYPEFSLHPALAASRANLTLAPLLYEPLFQVDGSFQAQPVLCQSFVVSEDKLVWTFTLRSGITFSDGTPLTGETAAAALELARSPGSRYAKRLETVASVSGEGGSVTVTLRRPNGSLPLLLDIPIALGDADRPAGTGPYVLAGEGEELSLAAREGWWQGGEKTLPVQSISLHEVSRSDELIYAFDAGDVSLVDVDLMATNAMGYGGNYQTWDYSTTDFLYLGFNTRTGVCRDPQVRRLLAMAVDRSAVASTVYAGHAIASALPVHPSCDLYSQAAADSAPAYDPEGMAAQLEGQRLLDRTLTFLVNSENVAKASAAQRTAYQLEAAGLTVELRQLPFEDYAAALARGEFDLYLGETSLTADFDLTPLLSSAGALNYGGWQDGETDGLLSALNAAAPEARPAAAQALFARLNDQVPIVPVAFKNGSVLTQWGRLSGLSPVRGNVFHQIENWTVQ